MTSGKVVTTVGYERRFNDALNIKNKERFVRYMTDEQPLKPANMANIVATNQGKRPLTFENPTAKPLSVDEVDTLRNEGHIVVDTRSSATFGAGHIPNAINIQLASGEFEQRMGWMTPQNAPIILLTESDADAQTAVFKAAFVALDAQIAGFVKGGISGWINAGRSVVTVPQIDVHSLNNRLNQNGLQVLDVRNEDEWQEGHIPQAAFLPYTQMVAQQQYPAKLNTLPFAKTDSIAVTCASGFRSSTAVSIMLQHGYTNLYNVTGGMNAWKAAKLARIDGEGQACPM